MKKLLMIALATLLLTAGCSNSTGNGEASTPSGSPSAPAETEATPTPQASTDEPAEATDEPEVAATAEEAANALIAALSTSDLATLQSYIHPQKGLLFSPYVHIDEDTAQVFQSGQLPSMEDTTEYEWGAYDGSGEPIMLTFKQYYEKFVYDQDFMNAEEIGWDEVKGSGNTTPNMKEVYPDSYLVDYYFSGFNKDYEGMDWESLILVLEEHDGGWYIVAIVHSQWTI